jgi:hypothetical protein
MGWRGFGFVYRSRTSFCRAVPNLISRFATFSSLYQGQRVRGQGGAGGDARAGAGALRRGLRRSRAHGAPVAAEQAGGGVELPPGAGQGRRGRPACGVAQAVSSDDKVANREIRAWHLVIENGY